MSVTVADSLDHSVGYSLNHSLSHSPNYSLGLRSFFAVTWQKIHILVLLCAAWTLLLLAVAPSSFADDKIPQDEYEASLMNSYSKALTSTGMTDEQISSFVTCLSDTTYDDLSAETDQALTEGNLDYEISGEEADIVLSGMQTCIADNGLSDVVINPESQENDGNDDVSTVETSDTELSDTSKAESPTYLLPLATALTLLAIIAFAFYLLIRGKARDAEKQPAQAADEN